MSVTTTFSALATRLLAANPTPSPVLTRVITDLSNRFGPGDCPLALIRLATDVDDESRSETLDQPGLIRDKYLVRILIFLGVLTGPDMLNIYHIQAKPWGRALGVALAADMTLSGDVAFIGDDYSPKLFTYRVGVIPWVGDVNYFGLTVILPVTEKLSTSISVTGGLVTEGSDPFITEGGDPMIVES